MPRGFRTGRVAGPGTFLLAATLAAWSVPCAPAAIAGDDDGVLDSAFRVDIDSITAVFDVYPAEHRTQAQATVRFRMRSGQTLPIFHLEPARLPRAQVSLRLDGETLDVARPEDVKLVSFQGSPQIGIELQRPLRGGAPHVLEAAYTVPFPDVFGRLYSDVNDLLGRGNEALFPTLNSPRELARHDITVRVHAGEPYLMVGSGKLTHRQPGDVQEWQLDTEREVASYTVLLYLTPARNAILSERRIQGVDVRVLASTGGPTPEEAFGQLDPWLAELRGALGPFPMPRGLSVVLTSNGGGMEYFGGTISSLPALRHEVFHMYFGCSTVAKTYRDSWWDEAINMWYQRSTDPAYPAIAEDFRSDIVSGRTPIGIGFDVRAYDEGARIIQALARDLGGRAQAVDFLRELHLARSFSPFTTWELTDEIRTRRGLDVRERFDRWLYTSGAAGTAAASPWEWLHRVDLTPPESVRRQYRIE